MSGSIREAIRAVVDKQVSAMVTLASFILA